MTFSDVVVDDSAFHTIHAPATLWRVTMKRLTINGPGRALLSASRIGNGEMRARLGADVLLLRNWFAGGHGSFDASTVTLVSIVMRWTNSSATQLFDADVTSYLSSQTRVRFVSSPAMGGGDWVSLREIHICGTYTVGPGPSLTDSAVATPYSEFPGLVGADTLHQQGITGAGVTVAVLDTGLWPWHTLVEDTAGAPKLGLRYDGVRPSGPGSGTGTCRARARSPRGPVRSRSGDPERRPVRQRPTRPPNP